MKNIFLYFLSILNNGNKCRHTNALLNSNEGYCPDCGVYLKKYYYVLRCKCCAHKREATRAAFCNVKEIIPVARYFIEKLTKEVEGSYGSERAKRALEDVKQYCKDKNIKVGEING